MSSQEGGGGVGLRVVSIDRACLSYTIADVFVVQCKGRWCFKLQKTGLSVQCRKEVVSILIWIALAKTHKGV
jgi:hypothetical protein